MENPPKIPHDRHDFHPQRFPIHGGTPFFRHCHPKDGGPSWTREVRYCRQPSAELYVQEPMRKCGWMAHSSPGVPAFVVSDLVEFLDHLFLSSDLILFIVSYLSKIPARYIYICIYIYMYVYIICHCISRYIIVFNPWICWWVNQFALVTSPPFLQSRWNAESRSTSFST